MALADDIAKIEAANVELRKALEQALGLLALPAVQLAIQLTKSANPDTVLPSVEPGTSTTVADLAARAAGRSAAPAPVADDDVPFFADDIAAGDPDDSAAREVAMKRVMPSLFGAGARERVARARRSG